MSLDEDVAGCLACDLARGRRPLPGGLIAETGGWRVEHCVGPLGVGTLLVKPARHVEAIADLMAQYDGQYGPALQLAMFASGIDPDPGEVEDFAAMARARFAASG
jgi:diadenosine tetraphosphate (Ap4A) HIT family hydrolase